MTQFAAPRGMRDFYPEEYREREFVFKAWEKAAKIYGFEFWDSPVVETMELLERKAGEEISEQIYTFEDKSNRRLALRAELTPSLARMIISKQKGFTYPLKWAAIGQCFRYERMTRGRKREHYQLNLDIIGEESKMAEVEVISSALASMELMGITSNDVNVHIGSRKLLVELLSEFNLDDDQIMACYMAMDKRGKVSDDEIKKILSEANIELNVIEKLFEVISIKTVEEAEKFVGENSEAINELKEFYNFAEAFSIGDYLKFDISIVRGLGYYTGIVFEAKAANFDLRTIFGGGRYNNLLSSLGGKDIPCVGLGYGDVVIAELLSDLGKLPSTSQNVEYTIGYMDADSMPFALKIASKIRKSKITCDVALKPEKAKAFFKRANRIGAQKAILIGGNEVETGQFNIKDMNEGTSSKSTIEEL